MRPAESLERLLEGNRRFASRLSTHVYSLEALRTDLVSGQHPFATIFGCADSRVPVEVIFDQGFGDLFVIRNAGHIVGESVLGSMEFAISEIGCRLIVVLGHTHCGASNAAVKAWNSKQYPTGHLSSIVRAIEPVVRMMDTTDVDRVMRAHVASSVLDIYNASPPIAEAVRRNDVWLVAAQYDIATQTVSVLQTLDAEAAARL